MIKNVAVTIGQLLSAVGKHQPTQTDKNVPFSEYCYLDIFLVLIDKPRMSQITITFGQIPQKSSKNVM